MGEFFLELLIDSLEQLEPVHQGPFLQKFLKSLASVDVTEEESLVHWQEVLGRRNDLATRLGRPVSLRTAASDYFSAGFILRNPILLEYQELKRLRHNAATDALTGLYNRRLFDEYLSKELSRSRRYSQPMTLVLFDLRNFKAANDNYGHAVGDDILRILASAVNETVRGSDYACRLGGDEFGIILPQSEPPSGHLLAQRIIQKFEQAAAMVAPEAEVGLDYGLASFPEDGDTREALFETSDRRLYEYKKAQKGSAPQPQAQPPAPPMPEAKPARPKAKGGLKVTETEVAVPPPTPLEYTAPPTPANPGQQRRRSPRISLVGTNACAVLRGVFGNKVAPVLDLGQGGIGLLLDEQPQVPDSFQARLQVSVLPAAEYQIHRVYAQQLPQGMWRLGCRFSSG